MAAENLKRRNNRLKYKLFEIVQRENLNYIYRGTFTSMITRNILALAESNLLWQDEMRELSKKVYFVMVEGLQNITRHQARVDKDNGAAGGFFALKRDEDRFYITTGNLIENSEVESLSQKIDKLNTLDKTQLKTYHQEVLSTGQISEKGGAGLGLIEIARRTGSKLQYVFEKVSNSHSNFYLHTEINSKLNAEEKQTSETFLKLNMLNPLLEKEDVLMLFSNRFNQESLLDIMSFLEKQMAHANKVKRNLFHIMIEMYQNIIKHASVYKENPDGKSAIFYISQNEDELYITSGNYISSGEVQKLRGRLSYVNKLDQDKLKKFYGKRLYDFHKNIENGARLGLIDLRIKSGNFLDYSFQKVNSDYYFYSLKVKISQK
jgi:hypothetical protein